MGTIDRMRRGRASIEKDLERAIVANADISDADADLLVFDGQVLVRFWGELRNSMFLASQAMVQLTGRLGHGVAKSSEDGRFVQERNGVVISRFGFGNIRNGKFIQSLDQR
jgi:hypothetical protein